MSQRRRSPPSVRGWSCTNVRGTSSPRSAPECASSRCAQLETRRTGGGRWLLDDSTGGCRCRRRAPSRSRGRLTRMNPKSMRPRVLFLIVQGEGEDAVIVNGEEGTWERKHGGDWRGTAPRTGVVLGAPEWERFRRGSPAASRLSVVIKPEQGLRPHAGSNRRRSKPSPGAPTSTSCETVCDAPLIVALPTGSGWSGQEFADGDRLLADTHQITMSRIRTSVR